MGLRSRVEDNALRCSFCQKAQEAVGKLISSPSEYPRAYICDECIGICSSILEDDAAEHAATEATNTAAPSAQEHPLRAHPMTSELLEAIERWIHSESVGSDAAEEIAAVRTIAQSMMAAGSK
jgi:ATP-dependent protease Clp ATPase subunit